MFSRVHLKRVEIPSITLQHALLSSQSNVEKGTCFTVVQCTWKHAFQSSTVPKTL